MIEQFDTVFDGASLDKQWGAAGSAAAMKAKLVGYLRDRLDIGASGSFDACESVEDFVDQFVGEMGSPQEALEAIDAMRVLI